MKRPSISVAALHELGHRLMTVGLWVKRQVVDETWNGVKAAVARVRRDWIEMASVLPTKDVSVASASS